MKSAIRFAVSSSKPREERSESESESTRKAAPRSGEVRAAGDLRGVVVLRSAASRGVRGRCWNGSGCTFGGCERSVKIK